MNVIKKTICLSIGCSLIAASSGFSASENLDELAARKARLATATWGKSVLENPSTLVWQPETLQYTDIATGREVWRLTSTNGVKNSLPDLGHAHWSADGKRFAFGSHRDTSACDDSNETYDNYTYQGSVMMMRADGSFLRPADNGPFETFVGARYLNWSPTEPDVYYGFLKLSGGVGALTDNLYRTTVSDTSISKTLAIITGSGGSSALEHSTAPDGSMLMAISGGNFYLVSLSDGVASLYESWSMTRALDDEQWWGGSPLTMTPSYHFVGLKGVGDNMKIFQMQDGYNGVWKMDLTGTAADGGPEYIKDHTAPYNFGGIAPIMTGFNNSGTCSVSARTPACCDEDPATECDYYMSHTVYDRWGRNMVGMGCIRQLWHQWHPERSTMKDHKNIQLEQKIL